MYWYRLENDTKTRTVEDKFVKNPDQYFKIGIKTWTHIDFYGIINAYEVKKDV
jgi:hypothetical protein